MTSSSGSDIDIIWDSSRRKSSTPGFFERTRTGLSLGTRETTEEARGPLGLSALFDPPTPLVDFIFVHGLGGGSRKTWSKSGQEGQFWPKAWLSKDPGFKHVRTHSFGYNANWSEQRDSSLNIHDFGKALLGELWNSPALKNFSVCCMSSQKSRSEGLTALRIQ